MAQIDIVDLRTRLGGGKPLSQAELATLIGVDQATVSRWEKNVHKPDDATSLKVALSVFRQNSQIKVGPIADCSDEEIAVLERAQGILQGAAA